MLYPGDLDALTLIDLVVGPSGELTTPERRVEEILNAATIRIRRANPWPRRYRDPVSFSASRLTCYALISAMESDMRALVEHQWPDLALSELSTGVVQAAESRRAKERLPPARTITTLLPYTDFADTFDIISPRRQELPEAASRSIESGDGLSQAFQRIVAIRNQVAHTKPMRLDDAAYLADIASRLVSIDPQTWSTLDETMKRISDNPAYVLGLTPTWRAEEPGGTPFHNLPIPEFDETGFFGRREELKRLKKLIKGNYPIVSVLGTGGIGKTALTIQAAYDLLDDPDRPFESIVWVTAKSAVLTATEIVTITDAVKDSLGLFSQAAEFLGGTRGEDPIEELSGYLASFKVLLILDNLETVLDPLLRDFLADIPVGSKVILTSRISLGMLDNPIALGALSPDDSINLLYALCRARGVEQLKGLQRQEVARYGERMGGHPSYIRWFVAGLQAGRRPEDLLGDSGLILEYCLSNVYDYLDQDSRTALGVFQVLPGAKNMAEVAHLNNFNGSDAERVLLSLLTTNFLSMSSRSTAGTLDSTYFLSEFAKDYLDRWHPIDRLQRSNILARNQELKDQGAAFSVEMAANPYSPETVTIRGVEDAHVARLLKEAMQARVDEDALRLCEEAQKLAPHYSEVYRVEAGLRARMRDDSGALQAYERAMDLSDGASTRFHFGGFLLNEAVDISRALTVLQEGARADPNSPEIASQISWAHYLLHDWGLAFAAASRVLSLPRATFAEKSVAAIIAVRATHQKMEHDFDRDQANLALEIAEEAIELCEAAGSECIAGESADLLRLISATLQSRASSLKGYLQQAAERSLTRLKELIEDADPDRQRFVSHIVRLVPEKGFGFVAATPDDYFVHVYELIEPEIWDSLQVGERCCFDPVLVEDRWRAQAVRILRL